MTNNTSKRGWTAQEDNIILQMMPAGAQDKFKWIEVSKAIQQKTGRARTGKQCRQRWQHQLNPSIVRDQWTQAEQATLFSMQTELGNKWAQISAFLPGRTDNAVKNYFYSSVRRVLTKINLYLSKQKSRKQFKIIRQFQADYLSKLMAVVDGHFDKRVRLTGPEIVHLAKKILAEIATLVSHEQDIQIENAEEGLDHLILMMQQFRKNCKKRKQAAIFDEEMRYPQSCSVEDESSQLKDSENNSSFSEKNHKNAKGRCRSSSIQNQIGRQIDIQQANEQYGIVLSTKNSTKSIEEENLTFSTCPSSLKLQHFESVYEQPRLFSGFSEIRDERQREDVFLELFREEQLFKRVSKMEEESVWHIANEDLDIFSLPFGQREDLLGESQYYGSTQIVTKFKMLEASAALEQCILKAKRSSCLRNQF